MSFQVFLANIVFPPYKIVSGAIPYHTPGLGTSPQDYFWQPLQRRFSHSQPWIIKLDCLSFWLDSYDLSFSIEMLFQIIALTDYNEG